MGISQVEANICAIAPPAPPENDGIGQPGWRRADTKRRPAMRDFLATVSAGATATRPDGERAKPNSLLTGKTTGNFELVGPTDPETLERIDVIPTAYAKTPYADGTGN
jgi:hypothetical protein